MAVLLATDRDITGNDQHAYMWKSRLKLGRKIDARAAGQMIIRYQKIGNQPILDQRDGARCALRQHTIKIKVVKHRLYA